MKKIVLCIFFTILAIATIFLVSKKTTMSNSELYKNNNQISFLLHEYSTEYNHEFKLASKEIEQRLYGKWQIGDTLGYSLKYDITGGALYDGKLEFSKNIFSTTTTSSILENTNDQTLATGDFIDYTINFKNPVFAYYQEPMNQMKQDEFIDNYSGITGLDPNVLGTVIIVMGVPSDSSGNYEIMMTKFIVVNDYIIAVRQSTFYKMEKLDS